MPRRWCFQITGLRVILKKTVEVLTAQGSHQQGQVDDLTLVIPSPRVLKTSVFTLSFTLFFCLLVKSMCLSIIIIDVPKQQNLIHASKFNGMNRLAGEKI